MVNTYREHDIIDTFVALSDTLVEDYDVVDLMQTLVEHSATLFDAVSAGLVLVNPSGTLDVIASTDEDTRLIELMQLQSGQGPCIRCIQTGQPVIVPDAWALTNQWADFRRTSIELNLRAAHCVPMRLRGTTIGSLNLFRAQPGHLDTDDITVIQAFADVATIAVLQQRALEESSIIQQQLQHALDSRIIIEQAKGIIAYTHNTDIDHAFQILRDHARATSTPITDVARRILRKHQP